MFIDQEVEMNIGNNKQYYLAKGYVGIKEGDKIMVKIADLPDNSHALETRKCDCCGKEYIKEHRAHLITYKRFGEDICVECAASLKYRQIAQEKQKQTCLEKYGVEWASQTQWFKEEVKQTCEEKYGGLSWNATPAVQEKTRQTNLKRYGYSSSSQSPEVKEKTKQTNLAKYGVAYTMQNAQVHDKAKATCLGRYGVENPSQNAEIQSKREQTFVSRYGYANPGQVPEIQAKIVQSLTQNGTVKTSQQQIQVKQIVEELYPDCLVELNYPVSSCFLDVVLFYNSELKIDIEYDGHYWHQDAAKDRARDEFIKTQGYKVLRIRSGEMIPSIEELKSSLDQLLADTDLSFCELQLPDWNKREY